MSRLKEESINPQKVLEIVKYRADWQRHQEAQKRKEEMIIERERSKKLAPLRYFENEILFEIE